MNCNDVRGMLSELEAGELSETISGEVRNHLHSCAECSRLLAALRTASGLVDRLPEEEPSRACSFRIRRAVDELLGPEFSQSPEILTPEELARFLRIPDEKLDQEIEAIPGFEIAGELRFRKDRVLQWIEEREKDRERAALYTQLGNP